MILFTAVVALLAPAAVALAADQATPQQNKMATCNKQASAQSLSGDARKSFMSQCLSASGGSQPAASTAAMSKEQSCAADADQKKLAGASRTSFIKKCIGG
jgi:hypothetical protein